MAVQRWKISNWVNRRRSLRIERNVYKARVCKKFTASQLPRLLLPLTSSWYLRRFSCSASWTTWSCLRPLATRRPVSAETTVVSMATCLLPQNGANTRYASDSALVNRGHDVVQIAKKLVLLRSSACFVSCMFHGSPVASTGRCVNMQICADQMRPIVGRICRIPHPCGGQVHAELFSRGLQACGKAGEVTRSARAPLRCSQSLVVRRQWWQIHACCKEGVASSRCVKLPTMSPLSHLGIHWLRRAELQVSKFREPTRTVLLMVPPPIPSKAQRRQVVLGHAPATSNLSRTPSRPLARSFPERELHHLCCRPIGHRHCQNMSANGWEHFGRGAS